MFKLTVVVIALCIACAAAKPGHVGVNFAAPLIAPVAPAPIVTAASSQVIARQYNGIAHTPIVAAPFAKIIAPAPYAVAGPAPVAKLLGPSPYAAPYAAPFAYAPHAYATSDAFGRIVAAGAPAPYAFPARYANAYSAPFAAAPAPYLF